MGNPWLRATVPRGDDYDRRFAVLAASGVDVHGEAHLLLGYGPRHVLDAGCGTGRVAIELARHGVETVGVDLDPAMLAAARRKAPALAWEMGDLAELDLGRCFDVVLLAGNVLPYLEQGTETAVVARVAAHVEDGGRLVAGWTLRAGVIDLATYDHACAAAGLSLEDRWATWQRSPIGPTPAYAVSVHRRSATTAKRSEGCTTAMRTCPAPAAP